MPRNRKPQTTTATEGVCGYCMGRIANQMVHIPNSAPNGRASRRWMCQPCIEIRSSTVIERNGKFYKVA
jgi:hypothetical protein